MSTPVGPIDYCLVPLQAPPAGQVSNFVNPTDLVTTLIVISTIFTAISVVFLAGRFIQNAKKMKVPDCGLPPLLRGASAVARGSQNDTDKQNRSGHRGIHSEYRLYRGGHWQ